MPSSERVSPRCPITERFTSPPPSPPASPRPPIHHQMQPSATQTQPDTTLPRRWRPLLALLGRSWRALGRSWDALGTLLDALGRSWVLFFDKNHPKRAPERDFRRSWLDFQLIFVPRTVDFHDFPYSYPRLRELSRGRRDLRKT